MNRGAHGDLLQRENLSISIPLRPIRVYLFAPCSVLARCRPLPSAAVRGRWVLRLGSSHFSVWQRPSKLGAVALLTVERRRPIGHSRPRSQGNRTVKIKGLDELTRKMKELEKAVSDLDGEIGTVSFDPHDPQSIELAIQRMETAIDERVGSYRDNDMVENIISQTKERYREAILERAAEARNEEGDEA